jgi:ADP-heptose:LPS heptosyltransferase
MKPCGHTEPHCRAGEYTLDQCRVCWLYEHSPAYRTLWDTLPGAQPVETHGRPADCIHLGRVLDRRGRTCPGCWVRDCALYGRCVVNRETVEGVRSCQDCPDYQSEREPEEKVPQARRLLLTNHQSPGDCLVMSAAIECLHRQHPGRFRTAVDSPCPAIFEHNPYVERPLSFEGWDRIEMEYPLIHRSCQEPRHFMEGYAESLGQRLGVPLRLTANRPSLYLSAEECGAVPQVQALTGRRTRYWVVVSGTKTDFTAKGWGRDRYQEVVDRLAGTVFFVQAGEASHLHPPLRGVLNLVGQTDTRQFLRLCYHAEGGLGGTTFAQHVFAALEKPYVCILGGREPVSWVGYPRQQTFHTIGMLRCCEKQACWKSRTVPLGDGADDKHSFCEDPLPGDEPVPRCMGLIRPEEVAAAVVRYYSGGALGR